jgi:hypothetical protein
VNGVRSSRGNDRGRIDTLAAVEAGLTEQFLVIYRAAFAPLDELAPARQGLTDDEFVAQMDDTSVVKVVGYNLGDEPVALTFMSPNLATVPWISPRYFQARFPDHMARDAVFYFGGLLVRAPERAGPWAVLVLEEAVRHVTAAGGVAVFDCCAHNVDRKLPELIARVARRICVLETAELEPQRYFAYTTHGFK